MARISVNQRDLYISNNHFNCLYGTMTRYMEGARYRMATSADRNGNFLQLMVAPGQNPEDVARMIELNMAKGRYVVIPETMITREHAQNIYEIVTRHGLVAFFKNERLYGVLFLQGSDKYAIQAAEQAIGKVVKQVSAQAFVSMFMPNSYLQVMPDLRRFLETENIVINEAEFEVTWDGILYKIVGEATKVVLTAKILNMATAEAFDSIQLKHIPDRKWISKGLKNIRIETGARIELQLRRELRNIIVKIDRRMEDLFDVTEVDLFKVIEAQMSKLVVTSHLFITGSPESREKAKQYLVQHMAQWVNVEAYLSECSGMKYQNYFKRLIPQYLGNYTYN